MYNPKANELMLAREAAKAAKTNYDILKKKAIVDVCQHIKESDKPYFTVQEVSALSGLTPPEIGAHLCHGTKMTRDMDKPNRFVKPIKRYYIEVNKYGDPISGRIHVRKVRRNVLSYNTRQEVWDAD